MSYLWTKSIDAINIDAIIIDALSSYHLMVEIALAVVVFEKAQSV